jgi:heptose I phosphotransferase
MMFARRLCLVRMIHLPEQLRQSLPRGESEFDAIMRLAGQVFREHKNRRTIRAELNGRSYFVKCHGPTGLGEIAKNALRGRWPVLTAEPEWRAIERLESLGVPTVHAVGWGVRGCFPHRLESFVITEELPEVIHLNDVPPKLASLGPRHRTRLVRRIIGEVARIARLLHTSGVNHRDFYLSHFMIRDRDWSKWRCGDPIEIYLIDLHRVQMRRRTPSRWMVKDIAALLFSAFDAGLTGRDLLRFLSIYWDEPWRARWQSTRSWRKSVVRRAVNLYQSERGRSPRLPAGLSSFA